MDQRPNYKPVHCKKLSGFNVVRFPPVLNRTPIGKVKIRMFEYFRSLKIGTDVFLIDADSTSPHNGRCTQARRLFIYNSYDLW